MTDTHYSFFEHLNKKSVSIYTLVKSIWISSPNENVEDALRNFFYRVQQPALDQLKKTNHDPYNEAEVNIIFKKLEENLKNLKDIQDIHKEYTTLLGETNHDKLTSSYNILKQGFTPENISDINLIHGLALACGLTTQFTFSCPPVGDKLDILIVASAKLMCIGYFISKFTSGDIFCNNPDPFTFYNNALIALWICAKSIGHYKNIEDVFKQFFLVTIHKTCGVSDVKVLCLTSDNCRNDGSVKSMLLNNKPTETFYEFTNGISKNTGKKVFQKYGEYTRFSSNTETVEYSYYKTLDGYNNIQNFVNSLITLMPNHTWKIDTIPKYVLYLKPTSDGWMITDKAKFVNSISNAKQEYVCDNDMEVWFPPISTKSVGSFASYISFKTFKTGLTTLLSLKNVNTVHINSSKTNIFTKVQVPVLSSTETAEPLEHAFPDWNELTRQFFYKELNIYDSCLTSHIESSKSSIYIINPDPKYATT